MPSGSATSSPVGLVPAASNFTTIGATLPALAVEVDFSNDPTNPIRVWTDITADVRQLNFTRAGRTTELLRSDAGTLTAVLSNAAGKYDPTNTGGSYYPGVKRSRWIRVRAQWAGVTYQRWQGLVETWEQEWPESGKDAICTVRATDAFKVLNLFDLFNLSFPQQTSDQRVAAVCAAAGLATTLDTGASTLDASGTFAEGSFALAHLQDVEATENGLLFAEADATISFQSRHYRLLNSATPVGTIGDAGGEIPYKQSTTFALDDVDLANKIEVTPNGGTAQTAEDATSESSYFKRTLTRDLLTSDANEALACAQYLLGRYKDSPPRLPTLEVSGMSATGTWPLILGMKNSQRFTWKRRAAAHTITTDVFIEQISESVTPGSSWSVTLQLSPAAVEVGWLLDSTTNSVLDTSTVLGY